MGRHLRGFAESPAAVLARRAQLDVLMAEIAERLAARGVAVEGTAYAVPPTPRPRQERAVSSLTDA